MIIITAKFFLMYRFSIGLNLKKLIVRGKVIERVSKLMTENISYYKSEQCKPCFSKECSKLLGQCMQAELQ
jgi:hypothetical protein